MHCKSSNYRIFFNQTPPKQLERKIEQTQTTKRSYIKALKKLLYVAQLCLS